jgi:hypothetical protein
MSFQSSDKTLKLYNYLKDMNKTNEVGNKILKSMVIDMLRNKLGYIDQEYYTRSVPTRTEYVGQPATEEVVETVIERGVPSWQRIQWSKLIIEWGRAGPPPGGGGGWVRLGDPWVRSAPLMPGLGPEVRKALEELAGEAQLTEDELKIARELGILKNNNS